MEQKVDLDLLQKLHAASTPGQWDHHADEFFKGRLDRVISAPGQVILRDEDINSPKNHWKIGADQDANWDCIAAIHNAFPALAAELRALRELVKELEAADVFDDKPNRREGSAKWLEKVALNAREFPVAINAELFEEEAANRRKGGN